MADNNFLTPGSLDFFDIKDNLKNFLKGQPRFKDYDFDGPNIAVLLDVLAYNTYLNAFYLNMVGNESFLDTALLRDSAVSHAKELNYLPRSAVSSKAKVDISILVTDTSVRSITIPAYSEFACRPATNKTYVFTNEESIVVSRSFGDTFTASGVQIAEGLVVREKFTVNPVSDSGPKQRYVLSNKNIDTDSIRVVVYASESSTSGIEYTYAESLFGLNSSSNVFFLQAANSDKYEVLFGDDVFGKAIDSGNVVRVTYRVTKGAEANGATTFTGPSISGYQTIVTTVNNASAGADQEDLDTIKYRAPRYFTAQDRAVTTEDYESLVVKEFPVVKSMIVYGGETVFDSVQYGRVFMSAITADGSILTDTVKNDIKNYLKKKTFLSLETIFYDPDFVYLDVTANASISKTLQKYSLLDLRTKIIRAVKEFNTSNLKDFGSTFRFSKFLKMIDDVDESIVASEVTVRLLKQVVPTLNISWNQTLNYNNPIMTGSLTSSNFTTIVNGVERTSHLIDDNGTLKVSSTTSTGSEITNSNVGTIDYSTGKLQITGLNVSAYDAPALRIYADPALQVIYSQKNQVLEIDETYGLNVIVIQQKNG